MADNESKTTVNHGEIRRWAEERDGRPSIVKSTGKNGGGLLRINFPGYAEDNLEDISWEEFFEIFDESNLEFLYQENTKDGGNSRFFKFINKAK